MRTVNLCFVFVYKYTWILFLIKGTIRVSGRAITHSSVSISSNEVSVKTHIILEAYCSCGVCFVSIMFVYCCSKLTIIFIFAPYEINVIRCLAYYFFLFFYFSPRAVTVEAAEFSFEILLLFLNLWLNLNIFS